MHKIELGTPDGTVENVERLAELFPQVVTEVETERGGSLKLLILTPSATC